MNTNNGEMTPFEKKLERIFEHQHSRHFCIREVKKLVDREVIGENEKIWDFPELIHSINMGKIEARNILRSDQRAKIGV